MKKFLLLSALAFAVFKVGYAQPLNSNPANSEMGFEENRGQLADKEGNLLPDVLFKSRGTGPGIYITTSGLTYVFVKQENSLLVRDDAQKNSISWAKVNMNLENVSIKKENISYEDELSGYSNFYLAHCPQGILNVKSYRRITIKNIYPGIDWVFNADRKTGLSHDFIVHPGADPKMIRINYKGTNELVSLDEQGRLKISTAYGVMYEGGLHVYEKNSGKKIAAKFNVKKNYMTFSLANYNVNESLIIDPPLQWSMPQTSSGLDYGYAISAAHDGSGDVLATGSTDGTDFPVSNAYQGTLSGVEDMVIERLNAAGARIWSTYYGGSDYEQGKSIASDAAGNCYVAGNTGSNDFPLMNPLQPNFGNGVYDAAIIKLNAAGVRQFASWYGSFGTENGNGITVDASGNMYVTGATNSAFFATVNPLQATKNIGYDLFIMKIDAAYTIQWATYYGGDDDDKGRAITMDPAGTNIYITGSTLAGGFPVTSGAFQTSSASAYNAEEAFILKMSTSQVVAFASYCGGSDADYGQGIAVDNNNSIFITGYTLSSDFPIENPGGVAYVDSTIGSIGTHDAFIVKCNSTGSTRLWSTYFGGSSPDLGFAIAYDMAAGIYICGNTSSLDFPTQLPNDNNFYQPIHGDAGSFNDMFIAWFGTNDSLRWSTYYGDLSSNEAYGICVDAAHNIFVTGVWNNDMQVTKFGPGFTTSVNADGPYYLYISIFPNPANEILNLQFASYDEGTFTFEMINLQGQLLMQTQKTVSAGNHNRMEFDLSAFAKGAYFLKITTPSGTSEVHKFIRE